MSEQVFDLEVAVRPDISHLITEDDEPVDNIFSAKQQRLLVEPLYSSWQPERSFVADANVGVFSATNRPPLVPDAFLSMDVSLPEELWEKEHRSYFIWEYGKAPDVVIEVVSNTKGHETERKLRDYARMRVLYYAIFDPQQVVQSDPLRIYELHVGAYVPMEDTRLEEVGLGLTLWTGTYDRIEQTWLRWTDLAGNLIPTGGERAEQERQRADQASQRADQASQRAEQASQRAEQERQRAERLVAQLRALGIEPEA